MTDLRDQLADFEATARDQLAALIGNTHITTYADLLALADRILDAGWHPPRTGRTHATATCHPERPHYARGLCTGCYDHHRDYGTLHRFPRMKRPTTEFATDYAELRTQGLSRTQIAWRLGMRRNSVDAAYRRAVAAGALTPDRRTVA